MRLLTIKMLLLLGVFTLNLSADKLRKPSKSEIAKIIKTSIENEQDYVRVLMGFPYTSGKSEFVNARVSHVKITKIGRASSNYYERSGSYINTGFFVKAYLKGSIALKKPVKIKDVWIKGRIPIRNVEFKIYISTDDFGDWKAQVHTVANKKDYLGVGEGDKLIVREYLKRHPELVKKEVKPQKREDFHKFLNELRVKSQRTKNIMAEAKNKNKREVNAFTNELTKSEDIQALNSLKRSCRASNWVCGSKISDFKNFYLPLVRLENREHISLVKDEHSPHAANLTNAELMKDLNSFFAKHPKVKKRFRSGRIHPSYLGKFSTAISIQRSKQERYLVFLELSKHLMAIKL